MNNDLTFYCPINDHHSEHALELMAQLCSDRKIPFQVLRGLAPESLVLLRCSRYVVVYNGSHLACRWVMNMRQRLSLPVVSMQSAMLYSDDHLMFDRGGCNTDSELTWFDYGNITTGDVLAFRTAFPVQTEFEDARTLVLGTCRTAADTIGFSSWIDERQYLADCCDGLGRENVVYRPPVGNEGYAELKEMCQRLDIGFSNPTEESWSDCVAKYSSAYSCSSARLLDFAAVGKPYVCVGESLLTELDVDSIGVDRVLAACWNRQFGTDASVGEVCEHLGQVEGFEEFAQ